jgi:hypothetical protein
MRAKFLLTVCLLVAVVSHFAGRGLRIMLAGLPTPHRASASAPAKTAEAESDEMPDSAEGTASPFESLDAVHRAAGACSSPADSRLLILEALAQMNAAKLEELITKHLEKPDFERLIRYDFQAAMRRLAEVQPRQAADLWVQSLGKTVALRRHLSALLEPWLHKAPKDFVAWHIVQSPTAQKAMSGVLGQFAFAHPDGIAELAEDLSTSPAGALCARRAVEGLRFRDGSSADLEAGLEFAKKFPEGKLRSAALVALADWPGVDVTANAELQAALASLPYASREARGAQLIPVAERLEPGPLRQAAVAAAVEMEAIKDSAAALKRIKAMFPSNDYSAAVRGYVEAVSEKDPMGALDLTLTIPKGDEQRAIALDEAALHLFRKKPDQAKKWVEQAALTAEEYFHLTGRKR